MTTVSREPGEKAVQLGKDSTMELEVPLTADERAEHEHAVAELSKRAFQLEEEKKAVTAPISAAIKDTKAAERAQLAALEKGTKLASVPVRRMADYFRKEKWVERLDREEPEEVPNTRTALSAEDRQALLPGVVVESPSGEGQVLDLFSERARRAEEPAPRDEDEIPFGKEEPIFEHLTGAVKLVAPSGHPEWRAYLLGAELWFRPKSVPDVAPPKTDGDIGPFAWDSPLGQWQAVKGWTLDGKGDEAWLEEHDGLLSAMDYEMKHGGLSASPVSEPPGADASPGSPIHEATVEDPPGLAAGTARRLELEDGYSVAVDVGERRFWLKAPADGRWRPGAWDNGLISKATRTAEWWANEDNVNSRMFRMLHTALTEAFAAAADPEAPSVEGLAAGLTLNGRKAMTALREAGSSESSALGAKAGIDKPGAVLKHLLKSALVSVSTVAGVETWSLTELGGQVLAARLESEENRRTKGGK